MTEHLLPRILLLLGCGFLVANVWMLRDLVRYLRRRRSVLLVWPPPKPRLYGMQLAIGVTMGLLVLFNLAIGRRAPRQLFGEVMMFLYFGYAVPLSARISRGFYRDGVWADTGFMPWGQISAVSWREEETVTLILVSHFRSIARRLQVPGHLYGQARRVLRDKVRMQAIHMERPGLDLGSRDDQDTV